MENAFTIKTEIFEGPLDVLLGLVEKRKLSQVEADMKYGAIKATVIYADMSDCDLVIEAVVEKMVVKKAVLAELEKVITKPFVFASARRAL